MADKVSKVVLAWQVQGESQAVASVGRVQAATNNAKKASDQLHETLTDLRVEAASVDLGQKYGEMAQDITKADIAAKSLADELARIGASKTDIAAAAREFEAFRTAQDASGTGSGGASALTKFGAKLRSLPSTRIPGTELGTDAIGNLARVIGTLPPVVLPVIALIGGVAAGFVLLGKSLESAREKVQAAVEAQNKYFQQLQDLNTKEAQAEVNRLKIRNQLIIEQTQNEIRVVQTGKDSVIESFGGLFDALGFILGQSFEDFAKKAATAGVSKDVIDNLDKLKKEYDANATSISLLEGGLKDATFATNDLNEAIKKYTEDGIQRTIELAGKQADTQIEIAKLIAEGSEKDLEAKKKSVEAEKEKALIELNILGAQLAAAKEGSAEQAAYQAEILKLTRAFNDADNELQALNDTTVQSAVAFNDAKEAQKKANEDAVAAFEKYADDRQKIEDDNQSKLAEIDKKYQDTLINAAETLADAGEKALQALKDKRDDLLTAFGRNELVASQKAQQKALEDQISYQEDSAKAARDHARELLRIQADAQAEQEDAIANRDFAALFRSRRNVTIAIQNSNREFQEQEAERALQFQQKQAADARQYAFEQQQRLQAYQFANADAEKQYNRQLATAAANYNKQIAQAAVAYNNELQLQASKEANALAILKASAINQIQTVQLTEAAKQKIFEDELAQVQALLASAGAGGGGFLGLGVGAGSSGFGFAGVGGNISNSSRSTSLNNTFNIRGNNPVNIAAEVAKVISGYLN